MKYAVDNKRKVELCGFPQKIHAKGRNPEGKILLTLHGGPGVPNRDQILKLMDPLMDDFIVVAWDQRGTGGSYKNCDPKTLTLDQLVEDANALVNYLCEEYRQDKVYLCGGSWGTELGTFLASRHPEHIGGYIGHGQVVNGVENEDRSYAYTVQKATEAGDEESLKILKEVGPPVDGQYNPCFEGLMAQRKILSKYGGHRVKKENYILDTALPILKSTEYSLEDKYGILKGYKLCLSQMWPTLVHYNFLTQDHTFQCPYYIFQGRHDQNTPSSLIEDYFNVIEAPDKDLVWFEHSAHGPLVEETDLFLEKIKEKFLR